MNELAIRDAHVSDADAVARLVTQLGYSTTAEQMVTRLEALIARAEYHTFLAERGGVVAGMVGVHLGYSLEFDGVYARLTGLVVDEPMRGRGVGTYLMHHVEHWLTAIGAKMLTLTSGRHRLDAHRFYQRLGYERNGVRFVRRL